MELGILTLGDLQRDPPTGRPHRPVDRMADILLPAVALAAAARTTAIRLASATTLLG